MPQPYSANLNSSHADNVNEVIHAADIDALATHVNQIETDANTGGPLDLPGHKGSGSADHDSRYPLKTGGSLAHPGVTDYIDFTDQGADPASPAAGAHRVYAKSGGLYDKSSAGTVVGAFGAGGGGGASSTFEYQPFFPAPASGDSAKMRSSVVTTITSVGAIRTGGTGATVDFQKNGVSILTTPISLTATTYTTGTLVASPNLAAGDILSVVLSGVSGSPTDVLTAVYGSRATF